MKHLKYFENNYIKYENVYIYETYEYFCIGFILNEKLINDKKYIYGDVFYYYKEHKSISLDKYVSFRDNKTPGYSDSSDFKIERLTFDEFVHKYIYICLSLYNVLCAYPSLSDEIIRTSGDFKEFTKYLERLYNNIANNKHVKAAINAEKFNL